MYSPLPSKRSVDFSEPKEHMLLVTKTTLALRASRLGRGRQSQGSDGSISYIGCLIINHNDYIRIFREGLVRLTRDN
jgi:hypothetical protein